jgi:hypothetical protein
MLLLQDVAELYLKYRRRGFFPLLALSFTGAGSVAMAKAPVEPSRLRHSADLDRHRHGVDCFSLPAILT